MILQAFINEKSLQGQFKPENVELAIRTFIGLLSTLQQVNDQGQVFKSSLFFNEQAISGEHLDSTLSENGDLHKGFLNNLKSAQKWDNEQMHDPEIFYTWNNDILTGTSVAEIAERKMQNSDQPFLLVNFIGSTYSTKSEIKIDKEIQTSAEGTDSVNTDSVNIDCSHDETSILSWLKLNGFISKHDRYDESSTIPPLDEQTVLGGPEFEKTHYKNKGRRAFRLKSTNQLWAVDASEGHQIGKPHIEVFSEIDGLHLGTSIYNEIKLDTSRKVNLRKININRKYPID